MSECAEYDRVQTCPECGVQNEYSLPPTGPRRYWKCWCTCGHEFHAKAKAPAKETIIITQALFSDAPREAQRRIREAFVTGSGMTLKVKRTRPDAILPTRATEGSVGYDLHAIDAVMVNPGGTVRIDTGIAIELPRGYEAQVRPRSSLSGKGIACPVGTIDLDYRGNLGVLLTNTRPADAANSYLVEPGARVAQLVVSPVVLPDVVEVEELGETARGDGGFGSTGE